MRPALVLLAAGRSRRLGTCKALVRLAGRTVLERLLEAGAVLDAAPPLVITGADHGSISAAAPPGVELLENPDWAAGRTGGVALAHGARPGLDLCLAPVDVPLVPAAVFEGLARAWEGAGAPARGWLAPAWAQPGGGAPRHGHPIVAGRELLDRLADPVFRAAPLRALRALATPLLALEGPWAEILDDLDTPEDLARLAKKLPGPFDS